MAYRAVQLIVCLVLLGGCAVPSATRPPSIVRFQNPTRIPITDRDLFWQQLVETVDEQFVILREERVLLTNDQDFLARAAEAATWQEVFTLTFYWPQQERSVGELVSRMIQEASQRSYTDACSRVFFF